jgi:predicted enzyme related to lactoylglutathione lyase
MAAHQSRFIWHELMTTDVAAATAFYRDLLGWNVQDLGPPTGGYTMVSVGDRGVGGISAMPAEVTSAGIPPVWAGYIYVADVDATAKQVAEKGGTIHRPPDDIPGYGRFAMAADPAGATFNIMTPSGQDTPFPQPGTPGSVGWNELHGGDPEESSTFYSSLFGWEKAGEHPMGDLGIYQLFMTDGEQAGGMMKKTAGFGRPMWLYYFNVADIRDAHERVKALGGTAIQEPHEVPGGSLVMQASDPQGARFALMQMAA